MRTDRLSGLRAAATLAVTGLLGLLIFGPVRAAQATTYVPLNAAGSTYAYPALDQWATDLATRGLTITYTPNGSAAGRQQYIEDLLDFSGSDVAFITNSDPDPFGGVDAPSIQFAYSYIPDVAGGLSFLYNLQVDGHKITNLRLSGRTLAEIFTGHIRNWDNPAIEHDYGAKLPNLPITVVTRSDGAGESYFLSRWLWKEYPSLWIPFCVAQGGPKGCGTGPTEFYPGQSAGFKSLDGSDDVAGYIASSANNGSIGYAEYAYAKEDSIPTVNMLNAAGYYVGPTAGNVAIALEKAKIDENQNDVDFLMQDLDQVYTDRDPRTYPLSSYSYLIVPRKIRTIGGTTYRPLPEFSTSKGVSLSTYINYILCGAQNTAASLGYSPLPKPMVIGGFTQDAQIPGAVRSPASGNYNSCDNPAYHDGKDVLTATAPYPSPCQKVTAPLDCVVKNGKATPAGGSTSAKTPAGAASTGPASGTNPNTGQTGTQPTTSTGDVVAQPVGLPSRPAAQWLFGSLAGLELLAVIIVPAAFGTWLQRRRRATSGRGR